MMNCVEEAIKRNKPMLSGPLVLAAFSLVSRVGLEPTTPCLKVRCSTTELTAHGNIYSEAYASLSDENYNGFVIGCQIDGHPA